MANLPVVIGTLGLILGMSKALLGTCMWDERTVKELARNVQTGTLNSSTRIIRRHLKVHQE